MTDITIPREALEPGARVLHEHAEIFDDLPWEDLSEDDQECYIEEARAVCQAMLKAWPGMEVETVFVEENYLILPLPKENSND